MHRLVSLVGALVAVARLAAAASPHAAHAGHDATAHHAFDDVAHWQSVFDDPQRDAWQKPDALVAALGLRRGDWVADLGAGTGYLSRRLGAAVGPDGVVFAVDTEPSLVAHLRERAEREGTANLVPVLASPATPRLPPRSLDVVVILDTYHHLDDRLAYLRGLARVLKPDGRVVIVDWQKRPAPVGPELEHKLAREAVVDEMTASGYALAAEPDVLPYQYFLVFRRGDKGDGR